MFENRTLAITNCESVEEARKEHKKLLSAYNYYIVRDIEDVRPGKINRLIVCKKERVYIVVMQETIEDRLQKMVKRHNRKVQKNKMIYADKP